MYLYCFHLLPQWPLPSLNNLTKLLPLVLISLSSLTQIVITHQWMINHLPGSFTETLWLSLPHWEIMGFRADMNNVGFATSCQPSDHPDNLHSGNVQGVKCPSVHVLIGPMSDMLHRAHSSCIWTPFHGFAVCMTDQFGTKAALELPLAHSGDPTPGHGDPSLSIISRELQRLNVQMWLDF